MKFTQVGNVSPEFSQISDEPDFFPNVPFRRFTVDSAYEGARGGFPVGSLSYRIAWHRTVTWGATAHTPCPSHKTAAIRVGLSDGEIGGTYIVPPEVCLI